MIRPKSFEDPSNFRKPRASGDDPATAITPGRVPRKPRASGDDPTGRPVYVLGPA